jgi:redox-sensing transcriptional repressor
MGVTFGGQPRLRVSDSSVRRLSHYHRILEELERQGTDLVSSARLAVLAGTNPAQIRKDLSYFGTFGKRGSGYPVRELRRRILEILGLGRGWKMIVVGAGNLGHALFSYKEFSRYGFHIVGILDNDPGKIGQVWDGIRISGLEDCESLVASTGAELAVIATPAAGAAQVVECLSRAGIRGFLNFAPRHLETPESVELRNVNITVELEGLTFALANEGVRLREGD